MEVSENGTGSRIQHPLLNSKVVKMVFEYLSLEECKGIRSVCIVWNVASCAILRSLVKISFPNASVLANYMETFSPRNLLQFPHSRFHFQKLKMNLIFDSYVLRKFFRTFSAVIRDLELDLHGRLFRLKFFRVGIIETLSDLRHLRITLRDSQELWPGGMKDEHEFLPLWTVEKLTISGHNHGVGPNLCWKPVLVHILGSLPNLHSIRAGNGLGELILQILYKDSTVLPHPPLGHLDFELMGPQDLLPIITVPLALTKLWAEVPETVTESLLAQVLYSLAPTLTHLQLRSTKIPGLKFPCPPRGMTSLVNLEIEKCSVDIAMFQQESRFPALRKLKLKLSSLTPSKRSGEGRLGLESLTLERCDGLAHVLPQFGILSPNLRRLHVQISESLFKRQENIFALVCEWFLNVEELSFCHDALNDEAVTGIPAPICRNILAKLKSNSSNTFKPNPFRTQSKWIGELERLRVLDLRSTDLSDFGILYGVLCCKGLQKLTLHSPYWMTDLSLKGIGDHLSPKLLTLDLFCSREVTESGINYLKYKMSDRRCRIYENRFSFDEDMELLPVTVY